MAKDHQREVSNPCKSTIFAAKRRADKQRAEAWSLYHNSGGEPRHFDYQARQKGETRQAAFEEGVCVTAFDPATSS